MSHGPSAGCDATCWCGGKVSKRSPGDENGLGCLENIWHDWRDTAPASPKGASDA